MPASESDISWQLLRRIVHEWRGSAAELTEVTPLTGGCINLTLKLTTKDGQRAVLKIAPHRVDRSFQREALQLNHLRDIGVPTPQVYAWKLADLDDPNSYLLMEYIDAENLQRAKKLATSEQYDNLQKQLAELVLNLHDNTAPHYARVGDDGPAFTNWPEFFRHVYDPIWHEAEKSTVLPVKCRKQIHKVHERLENLVNHSDVPRLVHWDMWSTNVLAKPDDAGNWHIAAILDPNCKYAHAEAEIAYMELFHTATPAFLKTYRAAHKLDGDYARVRRPVYQLYSLLNHLRLFGSSYAPRVIDATSHLAAVV